MTAKKKMPKGWIWLLAIAGLLFVSVRFLSIDVSYFISRSSHLGDIVLKMFPPEWSFASRVLQPILATVQMSVTGTVLGCVCALLIAPFCARSMGYPVWIRGIFKFLIQILRTFPALILALAATFVFGLGTFSGTAALTVYTFAIMTRLTYEDLESTHCGAYQALRNMGAGRYGACMQSAIPEVLDSFLSNGLYMLESNVRQSAILGYVGAGGVGLLLNEKMSWREYSRAGMILVMLFLTVCIIEGISHFLGSIVRKERSISLKTGKGILVLSAVIFVFCTVTLNPPDFQHTSFTVLKNMAMGFIRPDLVLITDPGSSGLGYLLLETVLISFAGTFLGAVIALPLSFLNTPKLLPWPVSMLCRIVVMAIRSVPFLIYGLLFVRVTGQGAFTGVLTVAFCSIGLITKRFTEAIEAFDFRAYQSLKNMGVPLLQRIRHALLPDLLPSLASSVLYRFDVNIREASILGLVGAGGIGAPLIFAMNHYNWASAGAICLGLIVIVWVIDVLSTKLRKRL